MDDPPTHWEDPGWLQPQDGPQNNKTETEEGNGQDVGVTPDGGGDGGSGPSGSGYIRLLPPKHSHIVHRD